MQFTCLQKQAGEYLKAFTPPQLHIHHCLIFKESFKMVRLFCNKRKLVHCDNKKFKIRLVKEKKQDATIQLWYIFIFVRLKHFHKFVFCCWIFQFSLVYQGQLGILLQWNMIKKDHFKVEYLNEISKSRHCEQEFGRKSRQIKFLMASIVEQFL